MIDAVGYIRCEQSGTLCQEPQKSDNRRLKMPTARPADDACCSAKRNLTLLIRNPGVWVFIKFMLRRVNTFSFFT